MAKVNTNNTTNWTLLLKQLKTERQFFNCSPALNPYVYPIMHFIYDHPLAKQFSYTPIPIGNIAMYIHSGAPVLIKQQGKNGGSSELYSASIQGINQIDQTMEIYPQGKGDMIVVGFKPGGFAKLFNMSAGSLQNKIVNITSLLPKKFHEAIPDIQKEKCIETRIKKTILLLSSLLNQSRFITHNHHKDVLNLIHRSKGQLSLKEICKNIKSSTRSVQRSFIINIGTSPKDYLRINRINLVMRVIDQITFENWHQIIYDYGYYDQAHFIHDFKAVTGFSPTEFLENKNRYKSIQFDRYGIIEFRVNNFNPLNKKDK